MLKLKVKKMAPDAILPKQAHPGDMYDLFSNEDTEINEHIAKIIHLGIAIECPKGYRAKIFARSSLPLKMGLVVSNSIAIIDEQYRGEIGLICNSLNGPVKVKKGDKIAQLQLEKIEDFEIEEVEELSETERGTGGFGSTGTK